MISGAQHIASLLLQNGIDTIFVLSGGHIAPIFVESKKAGIRVVDVRDEKHAVFAADAYARLRGIPGVAVVTAGPGLTNTITAVKNAQMAQSPVIILGGATATILKGRGSLQDIDQIALMKPHVKWIASPKTVKEIAPALKKAFLISQEGTPGPVFIELPVDLLYDEPITRDFYLKDLKPPRSIAERIQNAYIRFHVNRLFKNNISDVRPDEKVFPEIPLTNAWQINKAFQSLSAAKKTIIVVGSQALLFPDKTNDLVLALEKINAPVFLSGMARGLLGKNHPLQFRHKRKEAIRNADLVITLGVPSDFRMDYGRQIRKSTYFISANRSRSELFLNRNPDLAVNADPSHFLISLADKLPTQLSKNDPWFTELQNRELTRETEITSQATEPKEGINPVTLFQELDKLLPEDSILVADGGDFVGTASYILRPRKPLSWLDPGAFGTLGVGGGFALGAKAVKPESEVWIIWGDGSCGYSISEFDSMARQGLPVIGLVGNDAAWGQILRDQIPMLGDGVGSVLAKTAYHEVARGYGGDGICISSIGEFAEAVLLARKSLNLGKPFLINAILAPSEFRKGSISM